MTMPKAESAFFEDPDHALRLWALRLWALRLWEDFGANAAPGQIKGIKRPDDLCSGQAIERIAPALPQARFIAVLREPVSRAVSAYYYLAASGILPVQPLNTGVARCLDDFEAMRDTRAASLVSYGLYGQYLTQWYSHFAPERFLILSQEMVSAQPAEVLRRCASHLGIDPQPLLQVEAIRQRNVGFYDSRLLRLAHISSLLKTRRIPGTSRREKRSLPSRILGECVLRTARALAAVRHQEHDRLSAEIAARLKAHYDRDLPLLQATAPAEAIYWITDQTRQPDGP